MIRFILLLFPFFLSAEEVSSKEFDINCVVLDIQIFGLEDGKSTRYRKYENGLEVGQRFSIQVEQKEYVYEAVPILNNLSLVFDSDPGDPVKIASWIRSDMTMDTDFRVITHDHDFATTEIWESGQIKQTYAAIDGFMNLERYYKDDYGFQYVGRASGDSFLVNANCMNNKKLTQAIEKFFEYADKTLALKSLED